MSFTTEDLLTGDYTGGATNTDGMDYNPATDGNFADWLSNSGGVDQYDTNYEGLSKAYDTGTGINLHELEIGDFNQDFQNTGNDLTLLEAIAAIGFSGGNDGLNISNNDIDYTGGFNAGSGTMDAMKMFMSENSTVYSLLEGGPDLGFVGTEDAVGEGIVGEYELKEKQAYDAFNRKIEARATTLEGDISDLEGDYGDAIEEANLNKKESMSRLRQQEASRTDSLVNSLVSSGRRGGKGVRGGGKSKKLALQAQLDALQGLKSESKLARQTASEAMEAAAFTYGTWENGTRIGEAGTAEQGLNTAYNTMASDELIKLKDNIDSSQIEFGSAIKEAYDDWYIDLADTMQDAVGTLYGTEEQGDIFDPFSSTNNNTTDNSYSNNNDTNEIDTTGGSSNTQEILDNTGGGGSAGGYSSFNWKDDYNITNIPNPNNFPLIDSIVSDDSSTSMA